MSDDQFSAEASEEVGAVEEAADTFSVGGAEEAQPSLEDVFVDVVDDLESVTAQRDEYLDLARRVHADFENYKRRVANQELETRARAAEALVTELLPVLDACDAALDHGAEEVAPIQSALIAALERKGLGTIAAAGEDFNPELHDAVLSEPGEGGENGPVVVEVMRSGYQWNGRVVRPAMVKVRG